MTRLFALVALSALTIVAAACGSSGSETGTAAGGPSEAIQVHGRWTIDIYNADGTLDQHYEFENALNRAGNDFLVQSLAGGAPPLSWIVFLGEINRPLPLPGVPGVAPCDFPKSNFIGAHPDGSVLLLTGCALWNGPLAIEGPGLSVDLTVTVVSPPAGDILRLEGSIVATQDGTIDFVETIVVEFLGIDSRDFYSFTGSATGPFGVLSGQTIEVTVDISFS